MNGPDRGRIIAGAVLILLGLMFLAEQIIGGISGDIILFVVGVAFLVGYFSRRVFGLLIPGCLLIGIALGSVGESTVFGIGDFGAIGLGLGFVAIYLIHLAYTGSAHWWPLIPGGVLIVAGLAENPSMKNLLAVGWPLILVLVGLLILAGSFGLSGRKGASQDEPELR